MTYPLISEYVASIHNAADNLDKLSGLKPVMDSHGEPVHSSGAFAVVFKMVDKNGKYFALKCFTEEQTGRDEAYRLIADELNGIESKYLTSVRYYDKELFVDSNVSDETVFPVLLMDWIEGETMDVYIAENYQDNSAMEWLCYRFCKMASWLRSQPFAHGDIKPDNIIVGEDRELTLIDYDGMFVPAMKGWKSPTLGTKDFVHPNRKIEDFDETIDDFTLSSIALSLKAISLNSTLYDKFGAADRLLFSAEDYLNLGKSKFITALQSLMGNTELMQLEGVFKYALALGNLSTVSFMCFNVRQPKTRQVDQLTIKVIEKLCEVQGLNFVDYHTRYSEDGKKLLDVSRNVSGKYLIKEGTIEICDFAFGTFSESCIGLTSINIPSSVVRIGDSAFCGCLKLTSITIPSSVANIGKNLFYLCDKLQTIKVHPDNVRYSSYDNCNAIIDKKTKCLIAGCMNTIIPFRVTSIGDYAFSGCTNLTSINIPSGVTSIGKCAFSESCLTSIIIPSSMTSIGDWSFYGCEFLRSVTIPSSVTSIGDYAFCDCRTLESITIPSNVKSIGDSAFSGCTELVSITISSSVNSIGTQVFCCCFNLTSIFIPKGTKQHFMKLLNYIDIEYKLIEKDEVQ